MMDSEEKKIRLYLNHGNTFIWNANDALTLRVHYRIIGTMVGCLPRLPRQNQQLGLPLQLLPEEATLLVDKGIARFVDDSKPAKLPTPEQVELFKQLRKKQYEEQVVLYKEERREEMQKLLPQIIEGRKAKKRKLMELKSKLGETSVQQDETDECSLTVDDIPIPPISEEHTVVQLFTENPWQQAESPEDVDWCFPKTEREVLRHRVFVDLWERGYVLTSGGKFGGDFLVYPGDPARYHSFFIAVCLPYHDKMSALDMVSMGRLGSNVKKTVLICSVDPESDKVVHMSLQWTGIG